MKTERCRILRWQIILFPLLFAGALSSARAQLAQPAITSIRQESTNVVVTVRVPNGVRRLTLEGRERFGPGGWEPRAVTRSDGSGGTVTFRLPRSRGMELVRVRGDATEPLPASFYSGTNSFLGLPGSSGDRGSVTVFGSGPAAPNSAAPPEPSRDVVESDIWKIRGQTLYFFNQYRGLQIIDITNPDAAVLRGTLDLPAAGEDLYLVGSNHVVLLARDGCYYGTDESQVLVVADNNGSPSVAARLSVAGYIQESRLVGTALYIASQTYRPVAGSANSAWEWGTLVSSFDLANPAAPVSRGTLWYAGYNNVVAATDRYLFVSTLDPNDWRHSTVRLIDISNASGAMSALGSVPAAGTVSDKFKISLNGAVLTLISQVQSNNMLTTRLETFSLTHPNTPSKLGELSLGMSEQLNATRFDGDRVYVVTFHVQFRIDPLWIVDLSDPARPAVRGQLEIPGWSTYLQPMGNRLVALGIETNRTTVSLFDVANAAQPALLSRVALGSGWSWSEANSDEKAFGVFPGAGLIVVPFQSWTSNGYVTQVQLVDLNTNALALRGVIEHQFEPRRATVNGPRILSISGREYLSSDFSDRDRPAVRGSLELAWPVDRLFVHGDHLIEVTTTGNSGWWSWRWSSSDRPTLRVTLASDPNHVLTSLALGDLPIVGVAQRGNHLYVAQGPSVPYWPIYWLAAADASVTNASASSFRLTILSLENLPQLSIVGQTEAQSDAVNWTSDWQAVWPRPGVLVWVGGMNAFGPLRGGLGVPINGGLASPTSAFWPWPWYWPGNGGELLAFDVSDVAAPKFASEVNLGRDNAYNWWSFSEAFTADGLVYLSHQTSEFIRGLDSPWTIPAETNIVIDDHSGQPITNVVVWGTWVQKFYLDVVDYADAQQPLVRKPINIPGTLNGLSRGGALLYTVGTRWTTNWDAPWIEYLSALAYDGVSAHLVDSVPLSSTWPRPVLVTDENIFIGRAAEYSSSNMPPSYIETWTLPDTGKLTKLGQVAVASPASTLLNFPGLLAAQESDNTVALFDFSDPAHLRSLGSGRPPGCLWFDLNHADGDRSRGLWISLSAFGVGRLPVEATDSHGH